MMNSSKSPFLLTVMTGPNAGGQIALANGAFTIGSDPDSDVVLDDVAGRVACVAMSGTRAGVEPAIPGVSILGEGELQPGRSRRAELPATLKLPGDVTIHLCRAVPEPRRRAAPIPLAIMAVAVGGFALVASAQIRVGTSTAGAAVPPPPAAVAQVAEATAVTIEPAPTQAAGPCGDCADQAAEALLAMIAEQGLAGLHVEADGDVVRVSGQRDPRQADGWSRISRAYDAEWGSRAPMLLDVSETADAPPIAVASAWLGDAPEVVTRDGARLRVGDVTDGGWQVAEIAAGHIALTQGDARILIDF